MKKTEIVPQAKAELALPFDFTGDVGRGMEGADRDSFATPFLRVLQQLSPQCDEANGAYVKGAKGGMLFHSVNGKLYDGKIGVLFLPCAFQRRFLQWGPRGTENSGFHGAHLPEEVAQMRSDKRIIEIEGRLYFPGEDGKVNEKKSDRLVDTRSHFGLMVDPEGAISQVVLALASTQIKKSKLLMTILSSARIDSPKGKVAPPTWMNKVKLTTVAEKNDMGNWFGVHFEPSGFVDSKELYNVGKAFHQAITAGERGANFAEAEEATASNKF